MLSCRYSSNREGVSQYHKYTTSILTCRRPQADQHAKHSRDRRQGLRLRRFVWRNKVAESPLKFFLFSGLRWRRRGVWGHQVSRSCCRQHCWEIDHVKGTEILFGCNDYISRGVISSRRRKKMFVVESVMDVDSKLGRGNGRCGGNVLRRVTP